MRLTVSIPEGSAKGFAYTSEMEGAAEVAAQLGDAVATSGKKAAKQYTVFTEQDFHRSIPGRQNVTLYMGYMLLIFQGNHGALLDDAGLLLPSRFAVAKFRKLTSHSHMCFASSYFASSFTKPSNFAGRRSVSR